MRYCGTVDPMEIRASESRKVGAPNLCDIDIDGLNRLTQTSTLLGRKGRGKRGNVSSFPLFLLSANFFVRSSRHRPKVKVGVRVVNFFEFPVRVAPQNSSP